MNNQQIIDHHENWAFINGYVMAMLEIDLDKERFADPKERQAAENATIYKITKKSLRLMIGDCEEFCAKFKDRFPAEVPHYDMGYRFWMSRQHDGFFTDFVHSVCGLRRDQNIDTLRELFKEMDAYAEKIGERLPELARGWVYVR